MFIAHKIDFRLKMFKRDKDEQNYIALVKLIKENTDKWGY